MSIECQTRYSFRREVPDINIIVILQFFETWLHLSLKGSVKDIKNRIMIMKPHEATHVWSRTGPTFCRLFATLNLTFATPSAARVKTVGSMIRAVISAPQASAKTWNHNKHLIKCSLEPFRQHTFILNKHVIRCK